MEFIICKNNFGLWPNVIELIVIGCCWKYFNIIGLNLSWHFQHPIDELFNNGIENKLVFCNKKNGDKLSKKCQLKTEKKKS